jgi:preprotein translocase subunit SecG
MTTFLIILHVFASLILITVVLLQSGKGAEMGVSFGSTYSQTIFGSRGPGSFLSKITIVVAALFMVSALGIAALNRARVTPSVVTPNQQQTKPIVPGTIPAPSAPQAPAAKPAPAPSAPASPAAGGKAP